MSPYCISINFILIINKRMSVDDVVPFIQNHKYMIKTVCVTKKTIALYILRNFLRIQSGYFKAVFIISYKE